MPARPNKHYDKGVNTIIAKKICLHYYQNEIRMVAFIKATGVIACI